MADAKAGTRENPIEGVVNIPSRVSAKLTDVLYWREGGDHHFQSAEFPFLIAVCDSEQEAVNTLYANVLEFMDEIVEFGPNEITDAERDAAIMLMERFRESFAAEIEYVKRRQEIRRGKRRRENRGVWRPLSPGRHGRSERLLPA